MATKPDIDKIRKGATDGVDEIIKGITLDDVKQECVIVRIGGKLVKLELADEQVSDDEIIRRELTEKFNEKLKGIRGFINEKAMEIENVISVHRNDYEKKERELEKRLSEANIMPDINSDHADKGLSVVRGGGRAYSGRKDVFTWIYRTTYKPTRYNGRPLKTAFAKKMVTPIIIEMVTEKDRIKSIKVKKYIGRGDFDHYHGGCWGEWKYSSEKVANPNDALKICEYASSVLDNINGNSLANRSPRGLPRHSTCERNIVPENEGANAVESTRKADERTGLNSTTAADTVWST